MFRIHPVPGEPGRAGVQAAVPLREHGQGLGQAAAAGPPGAPAGTGDPDPVHLAPSVRQFQRLRPVRRGTARHHEGTFFGV